MKKILFAVLIAALIAPCCKKDNPPVADAAFGNNEWVLSYIQDVNSNLITYFPGDAAKKITIVFTDSLNIMTFSGICNSGSGTYTYSPANTTLVVTDIVTTKIACKYVVWEAYVVQNLYKTVSYQISGSNLTIYTNGDYNLHFISD